MAYLLLGKRADHDTVRRVQIRDNRPRDVSQAPGHPVSLHRTPHRLGDHQTYLGSAPIGVAASARVHHDVGLHRAHPLVDCGTEIRRPRHPVLRRKHRARSCVELRSQRAAALATPAGHDRPAGAGPHPQPKPMHPRTAPVVGLKGPLALGHGCHSSLRLATTSDAQVWTRSPLVSSSSRSLAGAVSAKFRIAAVSPRSGDCSRVLTRFP